MTDAPCKDCTDRCLYCHSTCERYADWKAGYQAELDERRNSTDYEYDKFACARKIVKARNKRYYINRKNDIY